MPACAPALFLPAPPYPFSALRPALDEQTVRTHYCHHYVPAMQRLYALAQGKAPAELQGCTWQELVRVLPTAGDAAHTCADVYHHMLYFSGMQGATSQPYGYLLNAIRREFGSADALRSAFSRAACSLPGSGWLWLAVRRGSLCVLPLPDRDLPAQEDVSPVLCCDVWEHAYYLQYRQREQYLDAWWSVLDWQRAEDLYVGSGALERR
ncbi:MAG: superoxide dismutase [Eubacteriales bacterium]|nr:superoxide dismutase [Eubacteriales bacterium]